MFVDEFEKAWQILRSQGTVHESLHVNVSLVTGRELQDVYIYDKQYIQDDTGSVIKRDIVFMDQEADMHVIPLEDIIELKIL